MEMVKRRRFKFFGHTVREEGLARAVMEGRMEGKRGRGRSQGNWFKNLKDWSGMSGADLSKMAKTRESCKEML